MKFGTRFSSLLGIKYTEFFFVQIFLDLTFLLYNV